MAAELVVILGPTAVGKTEVGILVAEALDAEILSADSMQVYRGMEIGTAKPTPEQRARVRFHLVDVVDPNETFSAARFKALAWQAIDQIEARGKRVLIVGGTGLYLRVLLEGFTLPPVPQDPTLRARLQAEVQRYGSPFLHQKLQEVDPEAAHQLHPNDAVRIIRALEVYYHTGCPISRLQRRETPSRRLVKFGLSLPRPLLYQRINERVDRMMAAGFLEEVRNLLSRGYSPDLTSMKSLGYRHMVAYLQGRGSLEEAVEQFKRDTRRFAKRQITWFRREPDVIWLDAREGVEKVAQTILQQIKKMKKEKTRRPK